MGRGNGLDDLAHRIDRMRDELRAAVQPAVDQSAGEMATTIRRLAPELTSELKASITVTPAGQTTPSYSQPGGSHIVPPGSAVVTAGNSKVRYAHLVEFGTSTANAQPFFWPGYRLTKKRARARIKRAMRAAIKKGWAG